MTAFELPLEEGKPIEIVDYKVHLVTSPPEVQGRIIDTVDNYISDQSGVIKINYADAPLDEGCLNIYVCRFPTGKSRIHIFGKIKGQEFRTEKELSSSRSNNVDAISEKVKYVLTSSRNILRTYYQTANLRSLENHLMAFLLPL